MDANAKRLQTIFQRGGRPFVLRYGGSRTGINPRDYYRHSRVRPWSSQLADVKESSSCFQGRLSTAMRTNYRLTGTLKPLEILAVVSTGGALPEPGEGALSASEVQSRRSHFITIKNPNRVIITDVHLGIVFPEAILAVKTRTTKACSTPNCSPRWNAQNIIFEGKEQSNDKFQASQDSQYTGLWDLTIDEMRPKSECTVELSVVQGRGFQWANVFETDGYVAAFEKDEEVVSICTIKILKALHHVEIQWPKPYFQPAFDVYRIRPTEGNRAVPKSKSDKPKK